MCSAFPAWGTSNSRRAASPFVRLMGDPDLVTSCENLTTSRMLSLKTRGRTKLNCTATCIVLKAMAHHRRTI
ncbi:hypothetical protein TNCV_2889661 [Trichonephila clavipes]|nr:hypothetical protein TNCV_2889661 [Trichonephila clavipes]